MIATRRASSGGLNALLGGEQVRRTRTEEPSTLYAAVDVVAALTGATDPAKYWVDLKLREPGLAGLCREASFAPAEANDSAASAGAAQIDALDLEGVLRLAQSAPTARAERIRRWLAATARERLEEEKNPELAVIRTRRLYEQKGYSRRWVDQRLRGVSARHELTGEWFKRGATESDQYRELTNALMKGAFGMEVEQYRQHKNLFKTGESLRDHMTDLELALTALGETVAVALHREHDSHGYEKLEFDTKTAGDIVAKTRSEIEASTGQSVVQPGNYRDWWSRGRRSARTPAVRAIPAPAMSERAAG